MDELFQRIALAVELGEERETVELTKQALAEGRHPVSIVQEAYSKGVEVCGDKYNQGEYFLPELMLTGEAMKAGLKILMPVLSADKNSDSAGKIIMGAVEGDVHDIGKNICLSLLVANGFEVVDAGVDIPAAQFIKLIAEHNPDLVGLGSYMSTTLPAMEESLKAIKDSGFQGKIFVGGVAVNGRWAQEIDADGYAEDAWGCVKLCKEAMA
ncbi:MAG: cobalamin-dependent protein [Deltaproteobacteria bacterium]|nr:cobalamin-dependent protein [Deltaproteobacteria bacterium]